jgi:hypothetical protein
MDMAIIPYVLSFHEDYYQNSVLIPVEAGKNKYTIPYRAIGNKLRDLQAVDSSGNVYRMVRIFIEDLHRFQIGGSSWEVTGNNKYYIENDEIVLVGTPSGATGFLKVIYYLRPNALVSEDRVTTIKDVVSNGIVVSNLPSNITIGSYIDIVEHRSPNKVIKYDIKVDDINTISKTLIVDVSQLPANVTPGDQVSSAEETAIAQIPTELQSLLTQRVAARCLEALGDQAGLQAANAKIAEIEQKAATLIDARVEGSPMKVNPNLGVLKSIRNSRWR